jgi:hypothetical protein
MAVAILIHVIKGNCFTPGSATLEFDVLDVNAGIDNIDVYTYGRFPCEITLRTYPWGSFLLINIHCADNLVLLYVIDLRQATDLVYYSFRKPTSVSADMVINLLDACIRM